MREVRQRLEIERSSSQEIIHFVDSMWVGKFLIKFATTISSRRREVSENVAIPYRFVLYLTCINWSGNNDWSVRDYVDELLSRCPSGGAIKTRNVRRRYVTLVDMWLSLIVPPLLVVPLFWCRKMSVRSRDFRNRELAGRVGQSGDCPTEKHVWTPDEPDFCFPRSPPFITSCRSLDSASNAILPLFLLLCVALECNDDPLVTCHRACHILGSAPFFGHFVLVNAIQVMSRAPWLHFSTRVEHSTMPTTVFRLHLLHGARENADFPFSLSMDYIYDALLMTKQNRIRRSTGIYIGLFPQEEPLIFPFGLPIMYSKSSWVEIVFWMLHPWVLEAFYTINSTTSLIFQRSKDVRCISTIWNGKDQAIFLPFCLRKPLVPWRVLGTSQLMFVVHRSWLHH